MKVSNLIAALQALPQDAVVLVESYYGELGEASAPEIVRARSEMRVRASVLGGTTQVAEWEIVDDADATPLDAVVVVIR